MIEKIVFYAPEADFLLPYVRHAMPGVAIASPGEEAPVAVMISSTDIYDAGADDFINEDTPILTSSPWAAREADFRRQYPHGIILRCAPIVGTGMTGEMRRLTEEIYRGRFFHFPENEARKSVVHASDVAAAVALVAEKGTPVAKVYNLADGTDPLLHDIAEAIAYRLDNKRISNVSTGPQKWFMRRFYAKRYSYYTSSRRVSAKLFEAEFNFKFNPVCEYLRTHIYDENSL